MEVNEEAKGELIQFILNLTDEECEYIISHLQEREQSE